MNKRVIVAMSGGVDSSVAAYLLQSQGWDVIGVTIKTWSNDECRDEKSKGCCSIRDIDDARSVARRLNIPYYVMDLSADFKGKVIDYFVDEYLAGRTPNPCIECNRHIKFGILMQKAAEVGADFVATGHYARKGFDENEKRYFIEEGSDAGKDQSYVLFGLTQAQLERTLLPIGDMDKTEVRRLAQELGIRVHDKPDSQEICFVRKRYVDFVQGYAPARMPGQGAFVLEDGTVVGTHEGSHQFTIGQRKRIKLNGPEPYFVTDIRSEENEVVLGYERDLLKSRMTVSRVNWQLMPMTGDIEVKIRSRHEKARARIVSHENDSVVVEFEVPQKAVTPGQAAVFYSGARVVAGGWIFSAV